jgi:hypothetical protein
MLNSNVELEREGREEGNSTDFINPELVEKKRERERERERESKRS